MTNLRIKAGIISLNWGLMIIFDFNFFIKSFDEPYQGIRNAKTNTSKK